MPPPDKQYITNVYTALKENLPDFYKTPQEFESLMTSDSAYRSKAYAALKDNIEGFDRTPAEFDERIIGKQAPEPVYPKESVADLLLGKVDNKPEKGDMASLPGTTPNTDVEKLYQALPAMKAKKVREITQNNLLAQGKIRAEGKPVNAVEHVQSDDYNREKQNVESGLRDEDWMPSFFLGDNKAGVKKLAVENFSAANKENPQDVEGKLDSGDYILEDGKVKVKGGFVDNLQQGTKDFLKNIGLALNVAGAQANKNTDAEATNEIKYHMNQFFHDKTYDKEYAATDLPGQAGKLLGGIAPYTIPYADIPLMGLSNLGSNHQEIWGDPTLTDDQKARAIINTSNDAFMIGAGQAVAFGSLHAGDQPLTAKQLLSQYAPTANLKQKFVQGLYDNYKALLKPTGKDMVNAASVGAGTELLNNLNKAKEGVAVDFKKLPEAALDMATLDLVMKAPKVLTTAFSTIKEARRSGVDKVHPAWFNNYSKQTQDALNNIVSAPEAVYNEAIAQLDKSPDVNAVSAKQKIETFRNYYKSLPADLPEAAKSKALHILQLKTEAMDDARNASEPGIRKIYENRALSYDGLLQKVVEDKDIDPKKEPLLISRFAAPPPPPKEEKPKADEPQYFADGEAISRDDMEQLINTTHDIHLEIKNDPELTQKLAEKGRMDEVQPTGEAPKVEEGAKRSPAIVMPDEVTRPTKEVTIAPDETLKPDTKDSGAAIVLPESNKEPNVVALKGEAEQKPLTQSATDLLGKMKADGTSPTGINRSLEKIAADNGIEVTGATRPGDIINALKEKQKPEPKVEPKAAGEEVTFKTAKGSEYKVHEDGTTSRNKAFRPEHGEKEQGAMPRSSKTVYVTKEDAQKLSVVQATPANDNEHFTIAHLPDNKIGVGIVTKDGSGRHGKIWPKTTVEYKTEPEVGLMPVETWNGHLQPHFGNEIVEVNKPEKSSNTNTDAVQVDSPGEVLQREPEKAGSAGSERGGVEQKQQGDAPAGESGASGKENGSPDSGTKEVKKSAIPQPVEEKKAASLASEVKKLPLSHVTGLGMGTNQADGTYISTEKGGNRYDKSGTAQKVKVAISKPVEMTWDEVIELQNELLNKHRDQFEPMDFEMLQVPTGKMGMDDLRTPGVNKLAQMVTEQLKSLGYDSMYMRESATQEGQLVVFDRKNVKFEQTKEKPKSNVQKATEIEDLTEPRDLVLQHFIAGGKIHSSAIVEILGDKKSYPESEKRARIGLLSKTAPGLDGLAHKLMEADPTGKFNERDYKNAIEQVILDHNSTGSMANDLVSRYIDAVTSHDLTPEEHDLIGKDLERKVHEHVNNLPEAEQRELIKILEKYQRPNGTIDWKTLQEDSDGFDPDILSLSDKAQKHLDEALQKNLEPRQSEHGDTAAENGSSKEGEGEGSGTPSEAEVTYEPITNKEKAKELADKWREAAKFIAKGAGGDGTMMLDITAVPRFIISKAIEGAAKIIEASGSVADAIADVRAKLKKFADDNKIKYKEEGLDKATTDLLRKHGMLPEPASTISPSSVNKAVSSKMTGTRAEKEGLKKQIKDFARGYLKGAKDGTLAGQMAQGKEMAAQVAKLKEKHAVELQKAATRSTAEKDALALRHAKEIAALEKESQKRVDQSTVAAFGLGKEVGTDEGIVTGVKAGVKRGSEIEIAAQEKFAKDVAQYLKGAMFDGKLTESQAKAIARRAAKVGGNMNRMVDFMDYVDKVVDDVHYAEKIAEANKLQKQIRKYSKSDKTFANNVDILNALKRIPINKLQPKDLDTFMQIANEYKASRQTPLTEKGYEPFDTKKNIALLEKIQTQLQIDSDNSAIAKAEEMSGVLFLSADEARLMIDAINAKNIDAFMEALNKEKAEQLTHALQQRVKYSQMSIDEALKDTDFTDQFGEHAIKVLRRVADVDLSALSNDKVVEVIRAIDNALISGTPANLGRIDAMLQIHTNLPELEATTSKHLKHALNKFSEFADDLPILMKAIYGISETVAEFRRMTGWDKTFDGGAKAKTDFLRKVKEYDKFREDNKITNNPDDVLRRGMYGHAIQHEGGTPEEIQTQFDNNKKLIKDSIKSYAEAKSTEDLAKRLQGIYDEHFEHAKTLDDLMKHFAADLPDDVKAHGFWEKTYADLQPELKYITEAYHNEFFEGGTINYTPRSYNFTDRQTEEPGAEKMSFNNYVNKPTQNANSITRTVEKNLPAGMALDFNFDYSMLKQFKRAKYDIHTTEGRFMFSEFTKAPESKGILGGADNKKIITNQFTKAEAVQRGNKAENDVASNVLRDVAGTLRNLSSTAALGGFTAYPKQYVSVAAKTLGTLGKDAGLFFEVQKVPLKDLKILEQTSIIVRGLNQGGTNTGGKDEVLRNTQLVESVGGKALRGVVNLSTKARSIAMLSLEEGDVRVAKRSFLAYYMKYLKDHGVDIKAEDLVTEHERIDKVREQALAYAQQMIDESQVVSNNAMMSDFKRPDGNLYKDMLKGVVVPFNSFSSNTRARLIEDARMLYMGDKAQKKEAWKDLWTSVGEIVAYQSINTFVLQAVVKYPMHWLIDKIFGLEDSTDKTLGDHMMLEWKKFYSNVLKDTVVSGFGNAGEGLFLDSLNQVGWFWHNMTNPTDKTPKHEWMIKHAPFFVYDKVNPNMMDKLGVYGVFGNQIAGTLDDAKAALTGIGKADNSYYNEASVKDAQGFKQEIEQPTRLVKDVQLNKQEQKFMFWQMCWDIAFLGGLSDADIRRVHDAKEREILRKENKVTKTNRALYRALRQR